jgi:hypothetical protein
MVGGSIAGGASSARTTEGNTKTNDTTRISARMRSTLSKP